MAHGTKNYWVAVFAALLLTGCVSTGVGYPGIGTRVYSEFPGGGVIWSHALGSYSDVQNVAANYCSTRGNAVSSLTPANREGEFSTYQFTCGTAQPPSAQVASNQIEPMMQTAMQQCGQLGFQTGTPDFGNCVLQLMAFADQRANTATLQAQQAAEAQRASRERQLEQSLRLMQVGAGLMAGPPSAPSNTTTYVVGGRTVTCVRTGSVVNCN